MNPEQPAGYPHGKVIRKTAGEKYHNAARQNRIEPGRMIIPALFIQNFGSVSRWRGIYW